MAKAHGVGRRDARRAQGAPVPRRHRVRVRERPPPLDEARLGARGRVGRRGVPPRESGRRRSSRAGGARHDRSIHRRSRADARGQENGGSRKVHPADLGAHVLKALMERTKIDPRAVEDVVFGCLDAIGPQAGDIARTCWLSAGLPDEVPGVTIDRQCGSSQQAVHFAAQAVMSGTSDLVVAGGVQNMSMIPIGAVDDGGEAARLRAPVRGSARVGGALRRPARVAVPLGPDDRRASGSFRARRWRRSRSRATAAPSARIDEGRFARENRSPRGRRGRRGPAPRHLARRRWPASSPSSPAGASRPPCRARSPTAPPPCSSRPSAPSSEHNLKPRARIVHLSVRGDDPIWMLTAPIPATRRALEKAGMKLDQIDLVEINEAFASRRPRLGEGARRGPRAGSTSTAARSRWGTRSAPPARG